MTTMSRLETFAEKTDAPFFFSGGNWILELKASGRPRISICPDGSGRGNAIKGH